MERENNGIIMHGEGFQEYIFPRNGPQDIWEIPWYRVIYDWRENNFLVGRGMYSNLLKT